MTTPKRKANFNGGWYLDPLGTLSATCDDQGVLTAVSVPWFRVHGVLLNDPGRLVSVHCAHTGLVSGWAGLMLLFEAIVVDDSDLVFNPFWRQGLFVSAFCTRLALLPGTLDFGIGSHIGLAGLLFLAACWHWAFWDLDVFILATTFVLDLFRIFGIHLVLASTICFFFGYGHLTRWCGPGFWTTDAFGLVGQIRGLKPSFSIPALSVYSLGALAAHHLGAGCLGCVAGFWHIGARPGPALAALFSTSSIESVLASSLSPVLLAALIVSATTWYGSSSSPNELFGPSRFAWDSSVFFQELLSRSARQNWQSSPDQLLLSDYMGSNPAKGGLFRSGPALKSDGIVQNWLGHLEFFDPAGNVLLVRRMPAFFETFPVILVDEAGEVRAALSNRRADARFSIESRGISASLEGGILGKQYLRTASLVKSLARKAQLGQVFRFASFSGADGVFRTSIRGWFTFGHSLFTFVFLFGHIWHAGRSLFREVWLGVLRSTSDAVEYGKYEKL